MNDLNYAFRQLLKNPGVTTVAVLTLALGIGASTGVFTALQAILLQRPPYADPDRMVRITEIQDQEGAGRATSPANLLVWQTATNVFAGVSAYFGARDNGAAIGDSEAFLTGEGQPVRLKCLGVIPGLFELLRVKPLLGRSFTSEELYDSTVVILSYGCWHSQFGSAPDIIGRSIVLGGQVKTVIGVMPPGFYFPSKEFEIYWTPGGDPGTFESTKDCYLSVVGRLRPRITVQQAAEQLRNLAKHLEDLDPTANRGLQVRLKNFRDSLAASSRSALLLLLVAVAALFLIVCANIANLQLSRATTRGREFSIRSALGAGRRHLIRQVLLESLLISVLGGLLGYVAARATTVALQRLAPNLFPSFAEFRVDTWMIVFNIAITLVAPLLFGIIPALKASRPGQLGERRQFSTREAVSMRSVLVSSEVALSVMLLVASGLLVRSFLLIESTDPGFNSGHTVTFRLISSGREGGLGGGAPTLMDIERRLGEVPGIRALGGTWSLPLVQLQDPASTVSVEGHLDECHALRGAVTPGYFDAMQTPLLRGRYFNPSDTPSSLRVAVINSAFEKAYFAGENPIGRRLKIGPLQDQNAPWMTIVGVVADQKRNGIDQPVPPAVWGPVTQVTPPTLSFVLRGDAGAKALIGGARKALESAYKEVALVDVATLNDLVQGSIADRRFRASLVSSFGGLALLLSAIGVFGVLSFAVGQRYCEIGIRMALGAQRGQVMWLVLREGMKPVVIGLAVGLGAALASTALLRGLLYGVGPNDPLTFAMVPLVLLTVGALACWLPARQATQIDPIAALRYE
jgi:putative ABC transport system permease protein